MMKALIALGLALASGIASGASVAMVTDVQGKAALISGAKRAPLAILADLEPGSQIELDANTRVVALYLDGSGEYLLKGPGLVAIRAEQPEVLKGTPAEKRGVLGGKAGKDVRIKPVGMVQGALVMRSAGSKSRIQLLNPSGTRTLESRPAFRWKDEQAGLTYQFELNDETGRTLYETKVAGASLTLPASVPLAEDVPYSWSVSARLPDGKKYSSVGDFSIVAAGMRQKVEALRPSADAPFSDRVAYAAWLEQLELKDEARKYWRILAAERPLDAHLATLARE